MKHARDDYERIQDPAGKIPEDEPVFLLRGQDRAAPAAVRAWANAHVTKGGDPTLAALAEGHALAMETWQVEHGGKSADRPVANTPSKPVFKPTKQELQLLKLLRSGIVQSLEFGQFTIRKKGCR